MNNKNIKKLTFKTVVWNCSDIITSVTAVLHVINGNECLNVLRVIHTQLQLLVI